MSELAYADDVYARFYGQWHPAQVLSIGVDDVTVLWEDEFTRSILPRSDVLKRLSRQQVPVFDMAVADSDEEQITRNVSNSLDFPTEVSLLGPSRGRPGAVQALSPRVVQFSFCCTGVADPSPRSKTARQYVPLMDERLAACSSSICDDC